MATLAGRRSGVGREERFFLISAVLMAVILIGGFSLQLAMGRSSFRVPLYVHLHAMIFFGWTTLYLLQVALAATGSTGLHRRLGWLSVGWIPAMVVMGTYITVASVRDGRTPFFFQPGYFLVLNPLSILVFAGLASAAIVMRRHTQWHRRLMFCAMTEILGPGFGRILPLPLLIPHAAWAVFAAIMLFPIAGIMRDMRLYGRVHPAWWWGTATLIVAQVATDLISFSPAGIALYEMVTAGSRGAALAPLAFPPSPGG